jgi:ABC-2 type transport system ATP-binding protein
MADATEDPAIDLDRVAKSYRGKVHALRGVAIRVYRGEVFGLLGPNGAGKSTLVKIMMTVVRPTRAEGTLLGQPIGHKPTLAKVGYLPENVHFPPYLNGRQALEFYAAMAKVDRRTRKRRATELLDLVGMKNWAKTKLRAYSKGMQQRIGLAQALVHDPELLVLDEPTDGLDPVGRRSTREVLKRLRSDGKTVFLNSHLLGEVEQVCDRVAILVDGSVIRQGTLDELTAHTRCYEIRLYGDPTAELQEVTAAGLGCQWRPPAEPAGPFRAGAPGSPPAPAQCGTLPSGEPVELVGTRIRIRAAGPEGIQPVIDALRRRQLVIESVQPIRQSLEDFFMAAVSEPATNSG